jgi:hypothetical protein
MYRIFISGPYTQGDIAINVRTAMNISNDLMNHGFAPYCPHLTHFLQINNPQPYEKWLELDMQYLVLCDAVYRFPGDSQGADDEVKLAIKKGIPVYYSIKELYKELL